MDDKRLQYVDMAKGIAILAIVLYHLTAPGIISSVCTHIASAMLALFFLGLLFFPLADATLRSTKKKSLLVICVVLAMCVAIAIIRDRILARMAK